MPRCETALDEQATSNAHYPGRHRASADQLQQDSTLAAAGRSKLACRLSVAAQIALLHVACRLGRAAGTAAIGEFSPRTISSGKAAPASVLASERTSCVPTATQNTCTLVCEFVKTRRAHAGGRADGAFRRHPAPRLDHRRANSGPQEARRASWCLARSSTLSRGRCRRRRCCRCRRRRCRRRLGCPWAFLTSLLQGADLMCQYTATVTTRI